MTDPLLVLKEQVEDQDRFYGSQFDKWIPKPLVFSYGKLTGIYYYQLISNFSQENGWLDLLSPSQASLETSKKRHRCSWSLWSPCSNGQVFVFMPTIGWSEKTHQCGWLVKPELLWFWDQQSKENVVMGLGTLLNQQVSAADDLTMRPMALQMKLVLHQSPVERLRIARSHQGGNGYHK